MTLRAASPASLQQVLGLYAAVVPMKPINVRAAILQHARSESEVYRDEAGDVVAAAMYYPLPAEVVGERLVELAFVCRPDLARHLVSFVHTVHLTRERLAQSGPVRVRAHVRHDHRPGHRLAALCGMVRVGRFGAFERYEFAGARRIEGKPDDDIRCRGQIAFQRT